MVEPGPDGDSVGPLEGLRVLEVGSLIAGPFAGRLLADLGADVIKIEAPDHLDPMRDWGHGRSHGRTLWWPVQTRNKRCITCDLRTPRGREIFLGILADSDALIENFRPGTLARWGLDQKELEAANPELIVCRISGFGQTGPYAGKAGFASAAEAMSSLRHINGFPGEDPPRIHISLGDSLGSLFATIGLLAALYRRVSKGSGQEVDVSLVESCFAMLESTAPEYDVLGTIRGPGGTGLDGIVPSNLFPSRDGKRVIIAANNDRLFARLTDAIGAPELATDPRYATHGARADNREELERLIAAWAAERDAAEIADALDAAGVVCGPVYTIADVFEDPHYAEREMLVTHEDEELGAFRGPGVVPRFSATPGKVRWSGPWQPGAHNTAVYGELLGFDDEALEELRAEGVI